MCRWQASRLVGLSSVVLVSCSWFCAGCGSQPTASYDQGLAYLKNQDFDTAIAVFDRVLVSDPACAEAALERGRARLAAGQARSAIADFDQYIQTLLPQPGPSRTKSLADAYFCRGEAYAAIGELPSAIQDYSQAIDWDANAVEAYRRRGQTYAHLASNPPPRAAANADGRKASHAPTGEPLAPSQAGPEEAAEYFYTAAIRDFTHLIAKNPQDAKSLVARGKTHAAKRRMYEAVKDFTDAIAADGNCAGAYLERGTAYAAKKTPDDLKAAISDFDKAIGVEPDNAEGFYQRGLARAQMTGPTESLDLAIRDLTEAIKCVPDKPEYLLARGRLLGEAGQAGQAVEAIADLQRAVEVNPQSGEACFELGLALNRIGQLPDASEMFARAVALEPAYLTKLKSMTLVAYRGDKLVVEPVLPAGQLRCLQGRIYLADSDAKQRAGDADEAQRLLDTAIGYLTAAKLEDPRVPDTHYWLGEAYVRKGQTDLARECFRQTTELDDKHFDAYLAWGKLLSARGEAQDHAVAADFFRQAIRLNARSGEAHLYLARACLRDYRREKTFKVAQAGETPDEAGLDEAIAHYEEAGKLAPGLLNEIAREVPEVLRLKAQASATRRQWDQAVAAVTKAIGREPGEPRNYLLRAAYQANAGQLDEASRDYEEAFQQGFTPPQTGTWLHIADALVIRKVRADLGDGQLAAARTKTRELEKAARGMLASAAKLHVDLARRHLEGGDLKLTIQESNAALACDETSADAYWIRGLAISRRGKPVLWEDGPGEPGEEQEHWLFPGWVKRTDMPDDWMPNSGALAREIAWGKAWEKKWTEAWRKAWQADLSRAAELSPRYETELGKMGIGTGRE